MATKQLTVEFGIIKDYPSTNITYAGDGETGVTITIEFSGAVSGIRINNTTRGEYLILDSKKIESITGKGVQPLDVITINTNKGKKSATLVRDGVSYNILHAIDRSSKWISLQSGKNTFTYSATTGSSYMLIQLTFNTRVLGV